MFRIGVYVATILLFAVTALPTTTGAQEQKGPVGAAPRSAPAARSVPAASTRQAAPRMIQRQAPAAARRAPTARSFTPAARAQSQQVRTQQRALSREPRIQQRQTVQRKAAAKVAAPSRTQLQQVRTQQRALRRQHRQAVQRKAAPKVAAPSRTGRKIVSPTAVPRVVTPRGARVVTTSRLRRVPSLGAGRAVIRGHNYTAFRRGYRIRHAGGWRTFVALSTLGAIAIGSDYYYPYAYISAPAPYCEGLTEDGCQLMWQDVETLEGDIVSQCVAYCPWQ